MKTSYLILFFLMGFLQNIYFNAYSQDASYVSTNIADAIKKGNAKELAVYFDSNIELTLLDKDGTYSKSQAEIIIKDFFAKNPPSDFSINHNGSSKDLSQFFIGSYKTANKQNFRIYYLVKSVSGKMLVQQLQIQE